VRLKAVRIERGKSTLGGVDDTLVVRLRYDIVTRGYASQVLVPDVAQTVSLPVTA
jgi:hypothetical protein